MPYKIISIVRDSGSGGAYIGAKVAEELGIPCYNQQLVEMALRLGDLDTSKHAEIFKKMDEKKPNLAFYRTYKEGNQNVNPEESAADQLFDLEEQLIKHLAETESAVIIGRCSNFILEHEDVKLLAVHITASLENRIARIMRNSDMDEAEAKHHIKKTDKRRDDFYYYMTKQDRNVLDHYNMILNSGDDDDELLVKILIGAFKEM